MKTLNALLAATVFGLSTAAVAAPKVGAPAPDFTVTDSQGKTHSLSQYRGKPVVLEWTNHDCPFVVKHYKSGNMQSLQKAASEKDVVWLTLISSAPGKQGHVSGAKADELTASRNAAPAAVLFDPDGKVGRAYDARTTPHMYIIDPKGALVYMGGIDSIPSADPADIPKATPYVKVALDEVLAGKPVSDPVTRPYGCSVKY
jgi:hypothetical protein